MTRLRHSRFWFVLTAIAMLGVGMAPVFASSCHCCVIRLSPTQKTIANVQPDASSSDHCARHASTKAIPHSKATAQVQTAQVQADGHLEAIAHETNHRHNRNCECRSSDTAPFERADLQVIHSNSTSIALAMPVPEFSLLPQAVSLPNPGAYSASPPRTSVRSTLPSRAPPTI